MLAEIVATTAGYVLGLAVFELFSRDWAKFRAIVINVVAFAALLYWVLV